jgi:hypothetical protein
MGIQVDIDVTTDIPGFELFSTVLAIGLCIGIIGWKGKK